VREQNGIAYVYDSAMGIRGNKIYLEENGKGVF
jgi:hypothetical protein